MKRSFPLLLTIACILQALVIGAQPINYDKSWVHGSPFPMVTNFTGSGPVNSFWTSSFNTFVLANRHSTICDANGDPLLITNGMKVWDKNRNLIDNGDTLAPLYMYVNEYNTGALQGSLILPLGDSIYYIFTTSCTDTYGYYCHNYLMCNKGGYDLMQYAKVDMKLNNYAGKVVDKRHTILDTVNAKTVSISQMTAVRHGNGQDWWLVKHGTNHYPDSTEIYTFHVKQDTVLGPFVQRLPVAPLQSQWQGQAVFNQLGNKYATVCNGKAEVFLADFDRCTGQFSNPQVRKLPLVPTSQPYQYNTLVTGAAFSPSASFLYITRGWSDIYQLEIDNIDSATAWYKVADQDTTSGFALYLGLRLAHDQKIYVGYEGNSWGMSYIANPDQKGAPCNFCPMCLQFPTQQIGTITYRSVRTHPNMANYALGPSNPPCLPPLSVANAVKKPGVKVYPNPTSDLVNVEYTLDRPASTVALQLWDMTGKLVTQQDLSDRDGKSALDVSLLPEGIYHYRLVADGKQQASGKIIIRH